VTSFVRAPEPRPQTGPKRDRFETTSTGRSNNLQPVPYCHEVSAQPMVLNAQSSYPLTQVFVLKLRQDSSPRDGRFIGRLEHVDSGLQFQFGNSEELLACLVSAAAYNDALRDGIPS